MKSYPTISTTIKNNLVWVFDKLDGSNIRVEWDHKNGFTRFGSRKRMLDESHPILGEAIPLIANKEGYYTKIANEQKWKEATFFFEFHGKNSFAGQHVDEPHRTTLIDVNVYKKGMISPSDFCGIFGENGHDIPNLLWIGELKDSFIEDVGNGTLENMTFEGVVCKYTQKNQVKMFKIKNKHWIAKLKEKCGSDTKLFEKLL